MIAGRLCSLLQVPQCIIRRVSSGADEAKFLQYALRSYVEDNKRLSWCPAPGGSASAPACVLRMRCLLSQVPGKRNMHLASHTAFAARIAGSKVLLGLQQEGIGQGLAFLQLLTSAPACPGLVVCM